jgi:drug/metabolite transporter (DMT)-like permease
MEASRVAVYHNVQPVIASAIAYVALGESIGWAFVIGGITVIGGVLITELPTKERAISPALNEKPNAPPSS